MLTVLNNHYSFISRTSPKIQVSPQKPLKPAFISLLSADAYIPSPSVHFQGHPKKAVTEALQKIKNMNDPQHSALKSDLDNFFKSLQIEHTQKGHLTDGQKAFRDYLYQRMEYMANLNKVDFATYLGASQNYLRELGLQHNPVKRDQEGKNRAGDYVADRLKISGLPVKPRRTEQLQRGEKIIDLNTEAYSSPPVQQMTNPPQEPDPNEKEALEGLCMLSQFDRRSTN